MVEWPRAVLNSCVKSKMSHKGCKRKSKKFEEIITEFDEVERLCLPNYNFQQTTRNKFEQNFPKHYYVAEYQNLSTPSERREYRNSKDLRNNHKNHVEAEQTELRICFTQLLGQRCDNKTCSFKHELRLPTKLRLCSDWKKGSCAVGQFCTYLHSEFPCFFHYLGLQHDSNSCRYYHGGPLPKEYEEMFLNSIDLKRHPMSIEMYKNRIVQLKATASTSTIKLKSETVDVGLIKKQKAPSYADVEPISETIESTNETEIEKFAFSPASELIEKSLDAVVAENMVNDCQVTDRECK